MTELETLQARVEQLAHELAESRKAEMDAVYAIADIREACGDNGRRMLPDLVAYVRGISADASRYHWLRDEYHGFDHYRTMKHCQPDGLSRDIDIEISKGARK